MSKGSLNSTMSNPWPTPGLHDSPGVYDRNMSEGDLGRPSDNGGLPCKFYDNIPSSGGAPVNSTLDRVFQGRK